MATHKHVPKPHGKEDWMNSKWRPAMGWLYMFVCLFDFVLAPVMWSVLQAVSKGSVQTQWQPLTLQGAGLFHLAMGAVLGIAAYGRTKEKLGFATGAGTSYIPPNATVSENIGAPREEIVAGGREEVVEEPTEEVVER